VKHKISVKIFIIMMIGFILILAISMKLNIDAQTQLYLNNVSTSQDINKKMDDIKRVYDISQNTPVLSYQDILDKVNSQKFKERLKTYEFYQSSIFIVSHTFKDSQYNPHKIIDYSLGSPYKDNYIQIIDNVNGGWIYVSIEQLSTSQKFSLLDYLILHLNSDEDITVDYRIENNQIVYLKWDKSSFGIASQSDQKTYINEFCIKGQRVLQDPVTQKMFIIDVNEMKSQVEQMMNFSYGTGIYSTEIKKIKNNYYFLSASALGWDKNNTSDASVHSVIVNVSHNLDNYVLQQYLHQNIWLYIMAFVIAVFISLILSYMISKPIRKVEQAALKIANQEFDDAIVIKSKDEIGSLAHSIDLMRKQLKENIVQLHLEIDKVKELESLRKDFINQFTHEMKTPLGIINGYSELIDETDNNEEREKYLDIINRETARINALIQSMLSLSRLEAGKVELKKQKFDLEDIVTEIIDEYEILFMKKNIHVVVHKKDSIIYADCQLIETVLHNFISNAIKHTYQNGNIIINIDNGVSVYNDGDLILEDRLGQIWYTFVTHDKEGSGLGLAICRSILELHDFEYGVQNKEQGVEFYFKNRR
jgi:signal transduction histidine kinase